MRLTYWNDRKGHFDWRCENNEIADKLAAYEDTGLTPEDILCIRATQRITPERLAEIVRAEFDGRLVILPCKVGDTVWQIIKYYTFGEVGDPGEEHHRIEPRTFEIQHIASFGKTVFLSSEEAEAALKGETEDV